MSENNNKTIGILFDLDGTLWDSAEGVAAAWNEILAMQPDTHKQVTVEDIHGYMGLPMDEIAHRMLGAEGLHQDRINEIMQACMDHENAYLELHGGVLYPRLEEVLQELSRTYFLAVVSNCQVGYIEAFLKYHKLDVYFDDFESFGATGLQKWDNISLVVERNHLSKAVYVGDIERDYQAAKQAEVPFVHAAYGFGQIEEPVPSILEFAALPDLLREMFDR